LPDATPAGDGSADPDSAGRAGDSRGIRTPVLLSTIRLDRLIEHEPADLVIGVQAGLSLERLNAALAAQRQWLPLDPPAAPAATIGAIAARGDSGPLRAGHGTPRDMTLGIEIATGDGRLLRFGGRVVKNVAGYDGVRLAVGSRGSLGIITALYLRVRGAPRAERTLALAPATGEAGARRAADLALAIRERVACDALELLAPAVAARLAREAGLVPDDSGQRGWLLLVRLLGGEAAVSEAVDRVYETAGAGGAMNVPASVWAARSRLEAGASTALRFSGSPAALAEGLTALKLVSDHDVEAPSADDTVASDWLCAAHAADGIIRAWQTRDPAESSAPGDASAWFDHNQTHGWTTRYDRLAGGAPAPGGPPDDRATVTDTQAAAVRALTQRLRTVFDPAGVLMSATEV
jgi:FAD/FMN-containing dehydrogenase